MGQRPAYGISAPQRPHVTGPPARQRPESLQEVCKIGLRRVSPQNECLRSYEEKVVGAEGFEPPTLCSQSRCATRLRYAPTEGIIPRTVRNAADDCRTPVTPKADSRILLR